MTSGRLTKVGPKSNGMLVFGNTSPVGKKWSPYWLRCSG